MSLLLPLGIVLFLIGFMGDIISQKVLTKKGLGYKGPVFRFFMMIFKGAFVMGILCLLVFLVYTIFEP